MRLILLLCFCISLWTYSHTSSDEITSQVSKNCALFIEDEEVKINKMTSLLKMDTVHMIDIQLFSGPNFTEPFFSQFQMTLVDEWGREVISLLDFKYFIVTSTLTVGHIKRFSLHVNESYEGCMETMDSVAGSLIEKFTAKLPVTSSQICYVGTNLAESSQASRICCKMNENYGSNDGCGEDQYQHGAFGFLSLPHIRTCFFLGAFLFIFIFFFTFLAEHDEHLSQETLSTYYRLTENTISIRYYVRSIMWENCGESVSIVRRFVLVTFSFCVYFRHLSPLLQRRWLDYILGIWGPLFWAFPTIVAFSPSIYEHHHHTPKCFVRFLKFLHYDVRGIGQCHHTECIIGLKKLFCLPFNIARWKEMLKKANELLKWNKEIEEETESSMIKVILDSSRRLIITTFICLPYIVVVFVIVIVLIIVTLLWKLGFLLCNLIKCTGQKCAEKCTGRIWTVLYCITYLFILTILLLIVSIIILLTWLPMFSGLLCNIAYFIPYIAVVLVSFYYLVQFWKSFNSKYSALKMFIYKEYQERKLGKGIKELESTIAKEELETAKKQLETAEKEHDTVTKKLEELKRDIANEQGSTTNGQHSDRGNGRGANRNRRGVTRNGRSSNGNARSATGNERSPNRNGQDTNGNGRGAIELPQAKNDLFAENQKLSTEKSELVTEKKGLRTAMESRVDTNKTLATQYKILAKANLKLATANERLARTDKEGTDAETAKKEMKTAKKEVETAKKEVGIAKEKVKTAKEEVETAKGEVETAKVRVEGASTKVAATTENVKCAKEKVETLISAIPTDEEMGSSHIVIDADKCIESAQNNIEAPPNLDLLCIVDNFCANVDDLNTKIQATANDQLVIANMLLLSLSQKGHIIPVISKKIYHKIQERILPYDTNLFDHVVKSLFIVLFTYFCIEYVQGRQESHFTDIVKVLTTISISVLPYFFNVLFLTLNEHENKTWKEMIKVDVKHIVDELDKDQKLDKTILILQRYICNVERTGRSDEESEPTAEMYYTLENLKRVLNLFSKTGSI